MYTVLVLKQTESTWKLSRGSYQTRSII